MVTAVGYLVVRLPNLNYLVDKADVVAPINGVYYAGVKRQAWADVFDETYYHQKMEMPPDILPLADALKRENTDLTGIDVCKNEDAAFSLLEYSNRRKIANELIVIRSPTLETIKGSVEITKPIDWLGFDCVALGEWSLISEGVFARPDHYHVWISRLNKFGLFDDASLILAYADAYDNAVLKNISEPLGKGSRMAVEVGRFQRSAVPE
jgi:hypothetical protein